MITPDKNAHFVAAPSGDFVNPRVPALRQFRKAKDVVKALIVANNPEAAQLNWANFNASVNAAERKVTLSLKQGSELVDRYTMSEAKEFTYGFGESGQELDFNALFTQNLGFSLTYSEDQYEAVIAALDSAAFETSYAEETQKLTVTVKQTVNTFDFSASNATLVTALFPGQSIVIQFVDEAIDVTPKFENTDLVIRLEDLLEAQTEAGG